MTHVSAEPTTNNEWASWFCTLCQQPCPSHNPCDHCTASLEDWASEDTEELTP